MNNSNENNDFFNFCNNSSSDYLEEIIKDITDEDRQKIVLIIINKRKENEYETKLKTAELKIGMLHSNWKQSIKDFHIGIKKYTKEWRRFIADNRKALDDAKEELHQLKRSK